MSQAPEEGSEAHVSVPTLSVFSGKDCVLVGQINGVPASILVDTGAAITVLSKCTWDRVKEEGAQLGSISGRRLVGVQGTPISLHDRARILLGVSSEKFEVAAIVADTPTADVILGRDFLRTQQCMIEMTKDGDVLHVQSRGQSISLAQDLTQPPIPRLNVVLQESVVVPPCSEMEVLCRTPDTASQKPWVVEGQRDRCAVMVARAVVQPDANSIPVRVLNPRDVEVSITKGTVLAKLQSVPQSPVVATVTQQCARDEPSYEHKQRLWDMVKQAEQSLTEEQKHQLYALLLEHHSLFATGEQDVGHTSKVQHKIDTGTNRPIRQSVRRVPQMRRQEAKKLIDDMLARDVIQPSNSPWASPVVLVPKKDGSLRFCIDYRKVNSVTRKDAYPLPRIDDTLDTLAGSKWFSTLDLVSGYWQVEVDPQDREKTAFCTHEGLFEFRVMPFGLCNAPATFQRLMDTVLAGLQWSSCLVYLDDIIIPGGNFQAHLSKLQAVFIRLHKAGLKLKPRKCRLCVQKVNYLGACDK